ncbi:trehalase family glycosidase [uncultured Draconibacterium sp.]|uniref:MGH1-like glycoside hydrolase domain-containing protein n=1 Tax=uncultured Draconibacterium sp. TaxID=1573823 RepID=UPI0032612E85
MKKIIFALLISIPVSYCYAQQLRTEIKKNEELLELRQKLDYANALMKKGVFRDDDTQRDYFTGYAYKTLYDWDQYFESIVQIYMDWPADYIKNGVTIFLDHQQESGMIPRSVPSNKFHDAEHVKPFLSQIILLVFDNYDDNKWMTKDYFQKLKLYLDFWLYDMDGDNNGLSEWMSAPHTGLDNQHERAGWWLDRVSEGVDLNSYLVTETRAFARIAEVMGEKQIAKEYFAIAENRAEAIRTMLWDEKDGFFYDRIYEDREKIGTWRGVNELVKVKSVAGFMPLWAQIATEEQAKALVYNNLMNPEEFWTPYPVPALAKSEPGYSEKHILSDLGCSWRANTWIPTNYMVYHGLKNYGYSELATLVAVRTQQLINKAGDREYYTSESGEGRGLNPFWGWSLLGHFFMFEETVEFDVTNFIKD